MLPVWHQLIHQLAGVARWVGVAHIHTMAVTWWFQQNSAEAGSARISLSAYITERYWPDRLIGLFDVSPRVAGGSRCTHVVNLPFVLISQ